MTFIKPPFEVEIGDAITWNIGCHYFIGRVNDAHPAGLIVVLKGKTVNLPWSFFEGRDWARVSAEAVRRLTGGSQ